MKRKISDLRVAELKQELEKRGLESKGLKSALVQRLQKAIEEDGGDISEIEISTTETPSPKVARRSRLKRNNGDDIDSNQEEDNTPQVTVNLVSLQENSAPPEVAKEENGSSINDIKPTDPVAEASFESSNDVPPISVQNMEEEIPPVDEIAIAVVQEESPDEREGKDNDFRTDEDGNEEEVPDERDLEPISAEDAMVTEEEVEHVADEEEEMDEVAKEMEEEESGAGEVIEREEVEVEEMAPDEQEVVEMDSADTENSDMGQKTEPIEESTELVETKVDNEKKNDGATSKDQEVVVSTEVDVLDMLDYDLEITGDQNNIGTDEQAVKSGEKKTETKEGGAKKSETEITNDEKKDMVKPSSSPPDKKTKPSTDSQRKSSSSEAAGDQVKSGSQSATKSAATTNSKEGSKSTSSGKSTGASSTAKKEDSTNKNLWISGLSSTTRASELKSAFSRYGKVIGAKVVTNVKSPGSRCYGFVTMATVEAANKCILHLNNTEMHGRNITVEIAKGDPSASSKKPSSTTGSSSTKKESESKDTSAKNKESDSKTSGASGRRSSTAGQASSKATKDAKSYNKDATENKKPASDQQNKDPSKKSPEDDKKSARPKSPASRGRADRTTSGPRSGDKRASNRSPGVRSRSSSKAGYGKDEPERKKPRQPDNADRKVVMDSHKGELRVNVSGTNRTSDIRSARWESEGRPKPLITRRRSNSPIRRSPPRNTSLQSRTRGISDYRTKSRGRGTLLTRRLPQNATSLSTRGLRSGRGSYTTALLRSRQRLVERAPLERGRADRGRSDRGRGGHRGGFSQMSHIHSEREKLRREREERERLQLEREKLERERRQLEKDRQERERLEQERMRLEQERKRELERIEREKAEMRRLQEITRYEVEQRQRAIKRTYENDSGSSSHRGSRGSNRDTYDAKRAMMSERGMRPEGRRGDREERSRGYDSFNSREASRNGPQHSANFRQSQGSSYRSSASSGHGKPAAPYHDSRRDAMAPGSHHDPNTRYGGSGVSSSVPGRGSPPARGAEKYIRREGAGRPVEYGHGYDRSAATDGRHADDVSQARRRGQQREPAGRDGRKVITREKTDHRGSSPDFHRSGRPGGARVEITRVEQSPPVRRARRENSPPGAARSGGAAWRDQKGSSSRREEDRDLREQIRGRPGSSSFTTTRERERERERGNQRRAASPTSSDSDSGQQSGSYSRRWPESASDAAAAQQIYAVNNSSSAVPTQSGRSSSSSAAWGHVAQWQQSVQPSARWPASAIPASASTVGRPLSMGSSYGAVPSPTLNIAPPGTTIIPATQAYIPATDRGSRSSFPASYKQQITRRY